MSPPARPRRDRPRLLTIAGSDSGGGAGIQADLKTFAAHGAYGMSALTALTAQNTREVRAIHPVPPEMVAAQIAAVLDDLGVDAIKIGMLANAAVVRAVAAALRGLRPSVPIVLDPVMIAKSGAALLEDDAVAALRDELLPLATVVTPNLPELARLAGLSAGEAARLEEEEGARIDAARLLIHGGGSADRGPAVLAKGGHARSGGVDSPEVVDLLVTAESVHRFAHPRIATSATHGTGCTLSSAIAARLALGAALPAAVEGAIDYLLGAIAAARPLGSGSGPVDHLYRLGNGASE
jgi:hydroxymethylpyrimidine/phosphomethylpyrimidine kinase